MSFSWEDLRELPAFAKWKSNEEFLRECALLGPIYNIKADEIAIYYESFELNESNASEEDYLSLIKHFKAYVKKRRESSMTPSKSSSSRFNSVFTSSTLTQSCDDFLTDYADASSKVIPIHSETTVDLPASEFGTPKKIKLSNPAPMESPITPSQANRGKSMAINMTFNENLPGFADYLPNDDSASRVKLEVLKDGPYTRMYRTYHQTSNYQFRYIAEPPADIIDAMKSRIERFTARFLKDQPTDTTVLCVNQISNEPNLYIGMITSCGEDNLTETNAYIEGLSSAGKFTTIKLNLSDVHDYCICPGQIVVIKGTNPSGSTIYVKEVLPIHEAVQDVSLATAKGWSVFVGAGPLVFADGKDMSNLNRMIQMSIEKKPDVLLLIGPLYDIHGSSAIENMHRIPNILPEHLSKTLMMAQRSLQQNGIRFVYVPSPKDPHFYCFPQPPLQGMSAEDGFVSNPCTLKIDNVVFGLTSVDSISQLSSSVLTRSREQTDRVTRLWETLLEQKSFYPLYPSPLPKPTPANPKTHRLPLSFLKDHAEDHPDPLSFHQMPQLLIIPSDLRSFAKVVRGVLCINPGRLVRFNQSGTFASITFSPTHSNETTSTIMDKIRVDIVNL